ncbi:MAG: glycosyltransferase family 2 protein, partial [Proteobacteria bacterium]|nr:glycosyltransferase family 2 protein [Pseudomonadota bacterium]
MTFLWFIVRFFNGCVLALLMVQSLIYLAQLVIAYLELRQHHRSASRSDPWWMLTSGVALPISILVPAHNEEETIVENVRSMLALHYPDFEVIVINDGSKDRTLAVLIEALGLHKVERVWHADVQHKEIRGLYGSPRYPRLLLVDKVNGGKSDALNAGINLSRFPLFCAVDADSLLDHDSLLQVMRPFIEEPEEMVAVGGRICIVNGCTVKSGQVVEIALPTQPLPLLQSVEYIRAFLIARLAWSRLGAMLIISGAFGLFKRSAAVQVGGYSHDTVGEDMEIVVKLHRHFREREQPYQMRFVANSVCWTQAPETLGILRRQRSRWQRGMMQSLAKHRGMIFNPKYGPVGTIGMGYFFLFDIIGPVVELAGLLLVPVSCYLGTVTPHFFLAWLALTFTYGVFLSASSLLLEMMVTRTTRPKDLALLMMSAVLENFGYRQLNSFWRIEGIWQFLTGKQGWGAMQRTKFQKSMPEAGT